MKKKVILISFLLCFSLSFFALEKFNHSLWISSYLTDNENKTTLLFSYSEGVSKQDIMNAIISAFEKYPVNFVSTSIRNGIQEKYLLSNDSASYFKDAPLLVSKQIDFSNASSDGYFTTDKNDHGRSGLFFTIYPIGISAYKVHTFHDIVSEDVSIYGWYVVSGKNKQEVDSFTEYLVSILPQTVTVTKQDDNYAGETLNVTPRNEILFISFVLFLLVLFMEVSKNMKEISLRKSMGESFVTIEIDLFLSFVWTVMISSVLSFMISYTILIQTFNRYTIPFIQQLAAYFLAIIAITLILMILLGGILYIVSPVSVIKNRNINKTLFNFNFIIKIIFIVFLFPQFIRYADKAIDLSGQLGGYLQAQEKISSVVELKAFSLGSEAMGNNELLKEFVLEFKPKWIEMSDFYFDEQSKDMPEEINIPSDEGYFDYLYLRVDARYLDSFPIKVNGELLTVDEKPILLIPESRRKSIGYSFIGLCDECMRVITKDKIRVNNFDNPTMFPYYENPVMIIYPSVNVNDWRFSENNLRIIEKSSKLALQKVSDLTAYFDKNVVFSNNQNDLQRKITELGTIWYYAFIVFLQGQAAIILVIIHGVTVLFQLNRKEIAIHYTIGYSFLQRSLYIVFQDIILFGLLWGYLLFSKYSILDAAKYALIVVVLDFVIASVYLYFNEKKQAIDAIKNC